MSSSLKEQVVEAWRKAEAGFARRGGPLVRTLLAEDPREAWERCEASLRATFAAHHGEAAVAERFHVPDDYATFMRVIGGGWKWPYRLEWSLWDADRVAGVTRGRFTLVTEPEEGDPEPDPGFWLSIGWWSDSHEYLLCCDRAHPEYGDVVDGHDSHPWLNGKDFPGCYRVAHSFLQWLRRHGDD